MTAVSEPMAADLRDRLGADAHTVTNGFDPEEVPRRTRLPRPQLDLLKRTLVHTGRMASEPALARPAARGGPAAASARGLRPRSGWSWCSPAR